MRHFIVLGCMIAGMWLWLDYSTSASGQKHYLFESLCAEQTGHPALKNEAERLYQRLIEHGKPLNETDLNQARQHWFEHFSVTNKRELMAHPTFQLTCQFNACLYQGNDIEQCNQERLEQCTKKGLPEKSCSASL